MILRRLRKLPRWLRRMLYVTGGLSALGVGFIAWALFFCFAEPPELESEPAIVGLEAVRDADGRTRLGAAWFRPAPGRSLLYLEGTPFELGYANAALTSEFLAIQEKSLMDTVEAVFPSLAVRLGLGLLVLVNNRNLPDYVPQEYQLEIFGLSHSRQEDAYPILGPRYHRVLNYHAAHDISHWVWDKPVIGCTAFAAGVGASATGELLAGRNFDWEGGAHFDRNKVIVACRPDAGHAFLSVSWPGMAGAVTGMNAERIYCSINGAHSERQSNIGRPVSLVVREVLQYASDLEQAVAIIRDAPVFVADSFLVADGETGEALVVEKAPGLTAVRGPATGLLLQTNHFTSEDFAEDAGNAAYMREGTSLARHARLTELCEAARGRLDVATAVRILRDGSGPGGAPRSLGHRATINPMIATHAVVAEVTRGVLWVSRGPHQLGEFDAYRLEDFGTPFAPPIPADEALANGDYERLQAERALLKELELAVEAGGFEDWSTFDAAFAKNPDDPHLHLLFARAKAAAGDPAAARAAYERALAAVPPFPGQARAIERELGRAVR